MGRERKPYGVGILGNCCTHGAGICDMFKRRPDTRVIAAYEKNPRRAKELQQIFGAPLARSSEEVINHPGVDFFAFLEVGKQQLVGEHRHSNSININFEHKKIFIDASAQVVMINHIPQDYNQFAEGATTVGSVEQLIGAIENGTLPTSNIETTVIATETLMAAYQSIIEERTVTLPLSSGKNPLFAAHQK